MGGGTETQGWVGSLMLKWLYNRKQGWMGRGMSLVFSALASNPFKPTPPPPPPPPPTPPPPSTHTHTPLIEVPHQISDHELKTKGECQNKNLAWLTLRCVNLQVILHKNTSEFLLKAVFKGCGWTLFKTVLPGLSTETILKNGQHIFLKKKKKKKTFRKKKQFGYTVEKLQSQMLVIFLKNWV